MGTSSNQPPPTQKTRKLLSLSWLFLLVGLTLGLIGVLSLRLNQFSKQSQAIADQYRQSQATEKAVSARLDSSEEMRRQISSERDQAAIDLQAATRQLEQSRIQELNLQAQVDENDHPQRSLLLSLEAGNIGDQKPAPAVHQALIERLGRIGGYAIPGLGNGPTFLHFSPDGRWFAQGGNNITHVWDMQTGIQNTRPFELPGERSAFSPDGHWLATGQTGANGVVSIWDLHATDRFSKPILLINDEKGFSTLAFDPGSRRLAMGSYSGKTYLQDFLASGPSSTKPLILPREKSTGIDMVTALAFSPDGLLLASANFNSRIYVWDLKKDNSISQPYMLIGRDWIEVYSIAFSPDGHWLASGDAAVRLWDVEKIDSNQIPVVLARNVANKPIVNFSMDGKWLAVNGDEFDRVWDMQSDPPALKPVSFNEHKQPGSFDIRLPVDVFSQNGKWLATTPANNIVRLWECDVTGLTRQYYDLKGHEGPITAVAISPNSQLLASASESGAVRLWNIGSLSLSVNPIILHFDRQSVSSLNLSPDGSLLAIVTEKQNPTVEQYYYTPNQQGNWVEAVDMGIGQEEPENSIIQVWKTPLDIIDNRPVSFSGQTGKVLSIAISPDNHWLAAGSKDGTAWLWNLQKGDATGYPAKLGGHLVEIRAIAFSPDGRWLVTGSLDLTARLWDLKSPDPSVNPVVLQGHSAGITCLAVSKDGHWLATGSLDSTIRLWDLSAADPTRNPVVLTGHPTEISALAFSSDDHWLASGSKDGTARLWDLNSTKPAANPISIDGLKSIDSFQFSSNGRWLISKPEVKLWDIQNATSGLSVITPYRSINSDTIPAFSPDSHWLALASYDGVSLIDLQTFGDMKPFLDFTKENKSRLDIVFARDSHSLFIVESDAIAMWLFDWSDLYSLACQTAGRNLNKQEWDTYFIKESYHKTCEMWSGEP